MDPEWSDMWEECEPFLDHAEEIWNAMKNNDEYLQDVKYPSIGAYSKCGCLKKLHGGVYYYKQRDLHERIKLILENKDLVEGKHIDTEGYSVNDQGEFYTGSGRYGQDYPCDTVQRRLVHSVSQQIRNLLKL